MKKLGRFLLGFIPSRLPVGMQEFDTFCISIFTTYDLPDLPSYRHAIASLIMHLGPTTAYKPKFYFALSVQKAMSNQIAFENIQLLKTQEREYEKTIKINKEETASKAPLLELPV